MSKLYKTPLSIALLAAIAANVSAQEVTTLPTITVEGEAVENSSTTSTVARTEILDDQANQISDVLNDVAGVDVGGSSAIDSMITLRGVPEYELNVTVDGARQEGYLFHHGGGYGIDPELLKQATVNTGTNSIRDVDSLGGSVEFETVDASDLLEDGDTFGGSVGYGFTTNSNTSNYSASAYGRLADQVDILAYGHYMNGHEGESGDDNPIGNATEQRNGLLKASWDITPEQTIGISYERYYNNAETYTRANFGYVSWNSDEVDYEMERDTYNLSYDLNPENNPYLDLSANAYYTKTEAVPIRDTNITTVTTKGIALENTSSLNASGISHEITVGAEVYKTDAEDVASDLAESISHQLIFVEDKIGLLDNRLEITPAIRYDHYKLDYTDLNGSYDNISFALSGRYHINDDLSVYAAATEIYQAPEMQEVLILGRYNYDADADTKGINYQIGADYDRQGLFAGNDKLTIGASVFYTDYSHYSDFSNGTYVDMGKAHAQGGELKIAYDIGDFSSSLSYARARSEFDSTGWPTQARGDMGDTYRLGLGYNFREFDTSVNWTSTFVEGFDTTVYGRDEALEKIGYGVSDLSLTYKPSRGYMQGLTLTAGVYNIFDKNYVDHASYFYSIGNDESIGRNYRLNLRYAF